MNSAPFAPRTQEKIVMSEAVLFPGQGAQFVGMGKDWCDAFPTARRMLSLIHI